ncbi:hypothetical protein [Acinetobacter sp.]|uniref:hypothetical protein n=1 Tax=Acinetobacter sp. TaxID=472 RepID=UPI000C0BB308|nr:hypothetical protein [Acinetobacter sp.]MAK29883.1 hypothetical protein [Acinetobacter sp.]|tara:strand:- start:3380 stop:3664 length:285 start_codon:yes stop_codon:yes gene_type:complete
MPSDPNLRRQVQYEYLMSFGKTAVHMVPDEELTYHDLDMACRCRPALAPIPEELRDALGPHPVPAIRHWTRVERLLLTKAVPTVLPLDLDARTL